MTHHAVEITAGVVASVFLSRGYLHPGLNAPIVLGVVAGASITGWWRPTRRTVSDGLDIRYRYLLKASFVVSCAAVIAGTIVWSAGQGGDFASLRQFTPAPVEERLAARMFPAPLTGMPEQPSNLGFCAS